MKTSEALEIGLAHHRAGRFDVAEDIYRRILAVEPAHSDAIQLLGLIAYSRGQYAPAEEFVRRAVALAPAVAVYQFNLGEICRAQEKDDEALACYRRANELDPGYAEPLNSIGLLARKRGRVEEALAWYRRALAARPDFAEAHNNLGSIEHDRGNLPEALASYQQALRFRPDLAEAHVNLGVLLQRQGRLDEALACYQRAIELRPDLAEPCTYVGTILYQRGELDAALAWHQRALALKPNLVEAINNLGLVLKERGQLDEAAACYRRALQLSPHSCEALGNLAGVLKDGGQLEEAVDCSHRAVALKPDLSEAHSNLLYSIHFCPGYDARTIFEEHRHWYARHAEPLACHIRPHANDRSPDRRLRIGYVSPDFRGHPVARFLLPLLESHDRNQVEVFCYSSVLVPDPATELCRQHADAWRDVSTLDDERLAQLVRQDRIDVLVDLTMHMDHSRLLMFARKPAPVQVTYLAYCSTTGLPAIDYRLSDPWLEPPGVGAECYAEQTTLLPETYWCYRPFGATPEVNGLPSAGGPPTFGSMNNFCKASRPALATWCRVLQAVPGSRLLLHAQPGSHRERLRALFAAQGVAPQRVAFLESVPLVDYYRNNQLMDIALDPFPYGGGTTTCDALWMGVPVVTLAGQTGVGRGGLSILSNIGLPELVARDEEQYVRIAAELAADRPRLAELRATLRQRMQRSPLMDAPRFARNVEAAFRAMWRRWCAG